MNEQRRDFFKNSALGLATITLGAGLSLIPSAQAEEKASNKQLNSLLNQLSYNLPKEVKLIEIKGKSIENENGKHISIIVKSNRFFKYKQNSSISSYEKSDENCIKYSPLSSKNSHIHFFLNCNINRLS